MTWRQLLLLQTLLKTWLVASGAGALNQFLERRFDAQVRRTARAPLAAARMAPASALRFGIALSCAGAIYLVVVVNVLASVALLRTTAWRWRFADRICPRADCSSPRSSTSHF